MDREAQQTALGISHREAQHTALGIGQREAFVSSRVWSVIDEHVRRGGRMFEDTLCEVYTQVVTAWGKNRRWIDTEE